LAEEYEQSVAFIGISDDRDTVAAGKEYATTFDVPYPLAHEQSVWDAYGVPYQPVTVVLDAKGIEIHRTTGPISYEGLRAELEAALARSTSS
jgi:hypothetical protein